MTSILTHTLVLGLFAYAIMDSPQIAVRPPSRRYMTRIVKLQGVEPNLHWSPESAVKSPAAQPQVRAIASGGRPAAAAAPKLLAYKASAPITLVQPDIPPNVLLPLKVTIPLMVMWSPPVIQVKKIVPPPLQKPAVSNARPSLTSPNHESIVADVKLASSATISQKLPLDASNTSPIALPGIGLPQLPQTASNASAQPMPSAVVSVSNVLLTEGTVALPPANEMTASTSSDSLAPGHSDSTSETGHGTAPDRQNGTGSGPQPGAQGKQTSAPTLPSGDSGGMTGSDSGLDAGLVSGDGRTITRMTLPHNGHFGVVVVGDSVTQDYPEVAGIWADKLAYTVYLHVGSEKSWILQYSLPRALQSKGNTDRPEAPWPYLIMTPHLPAGDSDSDDLLVHGFINAAGRFERLAIVFPPQFSETKFVLGALQQWQFRPAAQNGQSIAVEVLLIIPEETE